MHPKVTHPQTLYHVRGFNDWFSDHFAALFGSMVMFWIFFIYGIVSILAPKEHQTTLLLISSGSVQLWALPLLSVQANKADQARQRKADVDHKALTHIAIVVDALAKKAKV